MHGLKHREVPLDDGHDLPCSGTERGHVATLRITLMELKRLLVRLDLSLLECLIERGPGAGGPELVEQRLLRREERCRWRCDAGRLRGSHQHLRGLCVVRNEHAGELLNGRVLRRLLRKLARLDFELVTTCGLGKVPGRHKRIGQVSGRSRSWRRRTSGERQRPAKQDG